MTKRNFLAHTFIIFVLFQMFILPAYALSGIPGDYSGTGIVPCTNKCDFSAIILGINNIIEVVFFYLAVPLATILFAWAGFLYITAVGDEGKIKSAHRIFRNVLFGLVLMAAAWLIISVIVTTLADPNSGATQFLQGIR